MSTYFIINDNEDNIEHLRNNKNIDEVSFSIKYNYDLSSDEFSNIRKLDLHGGTESVIYLPPNLTKLNIYNKGSIFEIPKIMNTPPIKEIFIESKYIREETLANLFKFIKTLEKVEFDKVENITRCRNCLPYIVSLSRKNKLKNI